MAVFKCKMCGGSLDISDGVSVVTCEYCGTRQTVPKSRDEVVFNLFNRANNLRLKCEFDKAEQVYEKILDIDNLDSEAHWGVVLCKYGIEYVEDPKTYSRIPTCHRTLYEAVLTDVDYLAAIENADTEQKNIYIEEANVIDELQKNILTIVNSEEPFDVFICYKETDEFGKRTIDSAIANDIYYQLTQEGFKVFYAPITLEDKLGNEYEPYIFAALNSAKVMLVLGTKPAYFDSVWVRNEWLRFIKLTKFDRSKLLIPCYRDMDVYDLPDEFAHLQAQDMGKIGFITDVIRGLKKVFNRDGKPQHTYENKKPPQKNKNKVNIRESKKQIYKRQKLIFRLPRISSAFFIFTIIFYLFYLFKIGTIVSSAHDFIMFSLTILPFCTPLMIFIKLIRKKKFAVIFEIIASFWSVFLCLSDIQYSILNNIFLYNIAMISLSLIWMILICFTKEVSQNTKGKKKWHINTITAVLSIVLIIIIEIFALPFLKYQFAIVAMDRKDYITAYETFQELGLYKESQTYSKNIFIEYTLSVIKEAPINEVVHLDSTTNWLIVEKTDNKVLLVAQDNVSIFGKNIIGGWNDSSLRKYLNEIYYEKFSEEIKQIILPTQLINLNNTQEVTTDKVFILSSDEIERYSRLNNKMYSVQILRDVTNNTYIIYDARGQCAEREYTHNLSLLGDGYRKHKAEVINKSIENPYVCPAIWIDISGIN